MNRKKIVIGAVILSVLILGAVSVFLLSNKKSQARLTQEKKPVIPSPEVKKPIEWVDPAGFSFSYPDIDGIIIDKHDEDQENYAHVEMTEKGKTGNLIVWAKDAPAADLSAWVKKEKKFTDAPVLDTTLGGIQAKKIIVSKPTKMIVVGTLYDGMLVTVEVTPDESGEWEKRHDQVVSTLVFGEKKTDVPASSISTSSDEGGENISIDEEEVVE